MSRNLFRPAPQGWDDLWPGEAIGLAATVLFGAFGAIVTRGPNDSENGYINGGTAAYLKSVGFVTVEPWGDHRRAFATDRGRNVYYS